MTGARMDSDPLAAVIMYVNSCFHIDLIQFATVVRELKRHIREFEILVDQMGQVETAIAIGSFRACMKDWCLPELVSEGSAFLETEQLYHPLIEKPVKNSIRARRGVLLTGSNASGKSTFLKTVALNAILAQTLHTCLADSWKGSAFRVYSSMALRDDLESQESYYIVEIKSLKRILDQIGAKDRGDVLCFVDEVLRGTNTVERIAASSQVLRYMTGPGVMCFAATHDVELTHILEDFYDNYHFQEEVEDQDIRFDYRLYPGRAGSRNAIKLLQIMGYDEQVVDRRRRRPDISWKPENGRSRKEERDDAGEDLYGRGGQGKPGGTGRIRRCAEYVDSKGQLHTREYSRGYVKTTNNRMELMAAIAGLEALNRPCRVELYSDSKYLVDAFNQRWIDGWIRKDWKRGKNEPVKNGGSLEAAAGRQRAPSGNLYLGQRP